MSIHWVHLSEWMIDEAERAGFNFLHKAQSDALSVVVNLPLAWVGPLYDFLISFVHNDILADETVDLIISIKSFAAASGCPVPRLYQNGQGFELSFFGDGDLQYKKDLAHAMQHAIDTILMFIDIEEMDNDVE